MAASLKARVAKQNFQTYVEANFPEAVARSVLETAANPSAVLKAATAPAQTTVAGWATELADHAIGPVAILSPLSAFSQLARRPGTLRLSFSGNSAVTLPSAAPDDIAAASLAKARKFPFARAGSLREAPPPEKSGLSRPTPAKWRGDRGNF